MLSLSDLQLSISNLWDEFGSTDKIGLALVINGGLAAIGLVVYLAFDGVVAAVGLLWMLINLWGIVKWVFRL